MISLFDILPHQKVGSPALPFGSTEAAQILGFTNQAIDRLQAAAERASPGPARRIKQDITKLIVATHNLAGHTSPAGWAKEKGVPLVRAEGESITLLNRLKDTSRAEVALNKVLSQSLTDHEAAQKVTRHPKMAVVYGQESQGVIDLVRERAGRAGYEPVDTRAKRLKPAPNKVYLVRTMDPKEAVRAFRYGEALGIDVQGIDLTGQAVEHAPEKHRRLFQTIKDNFINAHGASAAEAAGMVRLPRHQTNRQKFISSYRLSRALEKQYLVNPTSELKQAVQAQQSVTFNLYRASKGSDLVESKSFPALLESRLQNEPKKLRKTMLNRALLKRPPPKTRTFSKISEFLGKHTPKNILVAGGAIAGIAYIAGAFSDDDDYLPASILGLRGQQLKRAVDVAPDTSDPALLAAGTALHEQVQATIGGKSEYEVSHQSLGIKGKVDVLLGGNIPMEIKSISEQGLTNMAQPRSSHVSQVNFYAFALDAPFGIIRYVSREDPEHYEEFRIPTSSGRVLSDVRSLRAELSDYRNLLPRRYLSWLDRGVQPGVRQDWGTQDSFQGISSQEGWPEGRQTSLSQVAETPEPQELMMPDHPDPFAWHRGRQGHAIRNQAKAYPRDF